MDLIYIASNENMTHIKVGKTRNFHKVQRDYERLCPNMDFEVFPIAENEDLDTLERVIHDALKWCNIIRKRTGRSTECFNTDVATARDIIKRIL